MGGYGSKLSARHCKILRKLLKALQYCTQPEEGSQARPCDYNSFTPTTNIELPPPSVETPPPQVTMENLSTVLATYHEQTVQPSLDLLSNHIRQDVYFSLRQAGLCYPL